MRYEDCDGQIRIKVSVRLSATKVRLKGWNNISINTFKDNNNGEVICDVILRNTGTNHNNCDEDIRSLQIRIWVLSEKR